MDVAFRAAQIFCPSIVHRKVCPPDVSHAWLKMAREHPSRQGTFIALASRREPTGSFSLASFLSRRLKQEQRAVWSLLPLHRGVLLLVSGGAGEGQRAGEIVWEGLRGRGVRTNVRDEKTSSTVVGASATKRLERERRASASTAPEETARDRRRKVGASASAKEDGGNPTDVQGAFPNVTRDSTERNGTSQVISKAKTPHHAR
eukprot:scaffold752_cov322-Pavlova_lutheri.AAC.16